MSKISQPEVWERHEDTNCFLWATRSVSENLVLDFVDMHSTLLSLSLKSAKRNSTQPFNLSLCFYPSPFHLLFIQHSEGNSNWSQFVSLQLQMHHLLLLALTSKTKSFSMPCVLGTSLLSSSFLTLIFISPVATQTSFMFFECSEFFFILRPLFLLFLLLRMLLSWPFAWPIFYHPLVYELA